MKYFIGLDGNQISSIEEYNNEHREKELTLEEVAALGMQSRQGERETANDSRTESGAKKVKDEKQ